MSYSKYTKVYYSEIDDKVWRTNSTLDDNPRFVYYGKMTRVEFDLLVECLFTIFGEDKIPAKDFKKVFDEISEFCQEIKSMIE